MQVSVTFRQMDPTPALKEHATDRVQKISKYVANLESSDASVVLSIEKYMHKADITINSRGLMIRGSEKSDDMYASIDRAIDKIERQLKRYREKVKRHKPRQADGNYRVRLNVIEGMTGEEEEAGAPPVSPRITQTEEFAAAPMSVDEAIMQMDLLDNNFLVFQNALTSQINVVYRRKDDNYGLIEVSTEALRR
ncbi:MAG: ribosome-associated translation inhibitor RaiA [Deltaproteobacteria bacterium]|nr:ribosome-associated translation inhibitor RaiA [Deltaproteobacteria bacterium]